MYQALVSVVIPVYNCEAYLQQCLDSLLCQTYSNIEIILVDDGSVDSSPQICDTYARYHDNIRAIHQVNSGAAAARNMGLEYVSGDYILFVDSDDWVTADYVQNLINPALEYNADITAGGMPRFCGNRTSVLKQHFFRFCCLQNLTLLQASPRICGESFLKKNWPLVIGTR